MSYFTVCMRAPVVDSSTGIRRLAPPFQGPDEGALRRAGRQSAHRAGRGEGSGYAHQGSGVGRDDTTLHLIRTVSYITSNFSLMSACVLRFCGDTELLRLVTQV